MGHALHTASYYLPQLHALVLYGNMAEYLIDYYVHRKDQHAAITPEQDQELKQVLGALALHITMRSPDESIAWTIHPQSATPYSLFATGSSADNFLVGQVITENIRHTDIAMFHSQVSREKGSSSKSIVKCPTNDIARMVEHFYEQSEQLPLKLTFSESSDEMYALVAMPGCDTAWFDSHTPLTAYQALSELPHKLMKKCEYLFYCNCSAEKLLPFLSSVDSKTLEELYGDDEDLLASCPRCGKQFVIARSTLDRS